MKYMSVPLQYIFRFRQARYRWPAWFTFLAISLLISCNSKSSEPIVTPSGITYHRVFPQLSFNNPTTLLQLTGDDSRWYLAEKSGRIYSFENDNTVNTRSLYLDISGRVDESFEGGLLGMAFDPEFSSNGFVYLSYTTSEFPEKDNSDLIISRLSRFSVIENNRKIDPDSEIVLLTLDQPWNNHNGGNIGFGPDGYLYLGFGDGGAWGDQKNHAQNTRTLFGALLRLDVRPSTINVNATRKYAIPADNPFASSANCEEGPGCPEIFAWGFRNPWRWSFDRKTGNLWVGDVGQGEWEEIDRVEKGRNYGWRCFEGEKKYNFKECDSATQFTSPVVVYSHLAHDQSRDGMAASVTGGYVYRGTAMKGFEGSYFYADFVHGLLSVIDKPYSDKPTSRVVLDLDLFIVSFAQDNTGELYFLDYRENAGIYKLMAKEIAPANN